MCDSDVWYLPAGPWGNPLTTCLKVFKKIFQLGTNSVQHDDRFSGCALPFASYFNCCLRFFMYNHLFFFFLFQPVSLCVALRGEWRSQYAGGWTAGFLQQESFTWQVDPQILILALADSYYFLRGCKNCEPSCIVWFGRKTFECWTDDGILSWRAKLAACRSTLGFLRNYLKVY